MPKRRTRWQITLDCLSFINSVGKASRMQLYEIVGSEENLNRWVRRLVNRWRAVDELDENGHKYYVKTDLGEIIKRILKYHADACYPLKEILVGFEPDFTPLNQSE